MKEKITNVAFSGIKKYLVPIASLFLGSLQTLLQSGEAKIYINDYHIPSNPKKNFDREQKQLTEKSYQTKSAHILIKQAFKDSGFKGKVFFDANMLASKNIGTTKIYNPSSAFVGTSQKTIMESSDEEIYAMGGHEAFHIKHHHTFIKNFLRAYLYLRIPIFSFNAPKKLSKRLVTESIRNKSVFKFPLFLISCWSAVVSIDVAEYSYNQVQKLCEIDADISAAFQLHVSNHLISHLNKHLIDPNSEGESFNDRNDHPKTSTRIRYLSLIPGENKLLFFQSETYRKILKERDEFKECHSVKKNI